MPPYNPVKGTLLFGSLDPLTLFKAPACASSAAHEALTDPRRILARRVGLTSGMLKSKAGHQGILRQKWRTRWKRKMEHQVETGLGLGL